MLLLEVFLVLDILLIKKITKNSLLNEIFHKINHNLNEDFSQSNKAF